MRASIVMALIAFPIYGIFLYLVVLIIKALRKYLKSADTRKEEAIIKKTLGETIKELRVNRKMTQEFVAESLGVSRQAVSKWEGGATDPSTSNLFALAKLFGITAEELLHKVDMGNSYSEEE